jgi:hypothetical protein
MYVPNPELERSVYEPSSFVRNFVSSVSTAIPNRDYPAPSPILSKIGGLERSVNVPSPFVRNFISRVSIPIPNRDNQAPSPILSMFRVPDPKYHLGEIGGLERSVNVPSPFVRNFIKK